MTTPDNAEHPVGLSGYGRCASCFVQVHGDCDGIARVHHVGGAVEERECWCAANDHGAGIEVDAHV